MDFLLEKEVKDYFVHHSDITGDGFKTLEEGQEVQFQLEKSPKGLKAVNVVKG
jgi:CspA family cold shock protein